MGFSSVCIFYAGDKSDCVCGKLNAPLCVHPLVLQRSFHKQLGLCWNENEGARKERGDRGLNPSESRGQNDGDVTATTHNEAM